MAEFPYLRTALFPRTECGWARLALEEGRVVRFFFCNSLCSPHLAFEMLVWIPRPWGSARQQEEEEGCVTMDANISLANDVL